jgi:hypothetical protein
LKSASACVSYVWFFPCFSLLASLWIFFTWRLSYVCICHCAVQCLPLWVGMHEGCYVYLGVRLCVFLSLAPCACVCPPLTLCAHFIFVSLLQYLPLNVTIYVSVLSLLISMCKLLQLCMSFHVFFFLFIAFCVPVLDPFLQWKIS